LVLIVRGELRELDKPNKSCCKRDEPRESGGTFSIANRPIIGDVNGDTKFTNADLQYLLTTLKSGGGSADSVPEPASLVLLGLSALAIAFRLRSLKAAVN
jgi:hypothetical protein